MAAFRYWRIDITRHRDVTLTSPPAYVRIFGLAYLTRNLESIPPVMTSASLPAPFVASQSSTFDAAFYPVWRAFDVDPDSMWISNTGLPSQWVQLDCGVAREFVGVSVNSGPNVNDHLVDFEVWGSSTGAFAGEHTVVHTVVGAETGWVASTPRLFRWDYSVASGATVIQALSAVIPKAQGTGRLGGTLKVMAAPAARTVRLYDRRTGELLRTTRSAPDGTYAFERLQLERDFIAVGLDDMDQPEMKNAAIADRVRASAA